MPTITWYRYGVTEGIPRMLDILKRLNITMTSNINGKSAEMYPDLARRIVNEGHEAACHGYDRSN
jgi:peptidoglycan/xylan/chitin deacetylase (PgdA/CDA1 family)